MEKIYFTVTGTKYYYDHLFLEPGMKVKLRKDPENEYDKEAIKVEMDGLGQIGSVANSPFTVLGESRSAGRIYDTIGDTASGTVLFVLPQGVVCALSEESLLTPGSSASAES